MSRNAEKALDYYKRGLWNKKMLEALVWRGYISRIELDSILAAK